MNYDYLINNFKPGNVNEVINEINKLMDDEVDSYAKKFINDALYKITNENEHFSEDEKKTVIHKFIEFADYKGNINIVKDIYYKCIPYMNSDLDVKTLISYSDQKEYYGGFLDKVAEKYRLKEDIECYDILSILFKKKQYGIYKGLIEELNKKGFVFKKGFGLKHPFKAHRLVRWNNISKKKG